MSRESPEHPGRARNNYGAPVGGRARRAHQLEGQTLLIIGGSSGIGLETARLAHADGAAVIIAARDPVRIHRAGLELHASIAAFDATDFDALREFFDELWPAGIDHVMVTGPRPRDPPLAGLDVNEARRNLEAHLLLPLSVAQQAPRKMRPGGTLLFTGCTGSQRGIEAPRFISAITSALSTMARALAFELAPVRVNVIAPGLLESPAGVREVGGPVSERPSGQRTTTINRPLIAASEVAELAVHLMTNRAVTGATFEIGGGQRPVEAAPSAPDTAENPG